MLMNKRIPADVEQLMWLIAESGDSKAAQEFEHRFPDFRFELMRRMSTVKALKASKPNHEVAVPAFRNVRPVQRSKPRWFLVTACSLGLGVFAFGSYAITQKMTQKTPPPVIADVNPGVKLNPVTPPKNNSGFQPVPVDQVGEHQPTRDPNRTSQLLPNNGAPQLSPEQKKQLQSYEAPLDLSIENAELRVVFNLIAQNSGLQLEFMPAAKNVTGHDLSKKVSVDYRQMSGVDMLTKLAKDNGFEAVYRDGNTFQIYPILQFMDLQNP